MKRAIDKAAEARLRERVAEIRALTEQRKACTERSNVELAKRPDAEPDYDEIQRNNDEWDRIDQQVRAGQSALVGILESFFETSSGAAGHRHDRQAPD